MAVAVVEDREVVGVRPSRRAHRERVRADLERRAAEGGGAVALELLDEQGGAARRDVDRGGLEVVDEVLVARAGAGATVEGGEPGRRAAEDAPKELRSSAASTKPSFAIVPRSALRPVHHGARSLIAPPLFDFHVVRGVGPERPPPGPVGRVDRGPLLHHGFAEHTGTLVVDRDPDVAGRAVRVRGCLCCRRYAEAG